MRASATTSERLTARAADGAGLALWRFSPRGSARAACLLLHAMMASGSYLRSRLAPYLAERGVEVFVLDWRGHGASVPPRPGDGLGWIFDDYVELDLPAALGLAAEVSGRGVGEIAYVGHSLGGLVGLAGAATGIFSPRRLVLFASSLWLPGPGGSRLRRAVMTGAAVAARTLGRAPARRLGVGSDDEPASYVEELARWAQSGRWESRIGLDYEAALGGVEAEVLAVTGEGDRLCRPGDAERFRSRLPNARPLRRVGRRWGDACDPDHFGLVTKAELAPVWDEVADFVIGA